MPKKAVIGLKQLIDKIGGCDTDTERAFVAVDRTATHSINNINLRVNLIKIAFKLISFFSLLYIITISLALKYFLSDLVFKKIEEGSTNEISRYTVNHLGDEALIREYIAGTGRLCAFYFPGQSGGIPRYEKEIFVHLLERNISVYAISPPGYEGAKGKSTLESVLKTGEMAVKYVNDNTACKISESIFIGRSLGAAIALKIATAAPPKGLLLDSTAIALSDVVRNEINRNPYLKPASILPIEILMEFNPKMEDAMEFLSNTPIVIFQGELDTLTPYPAIKEHTASFTNIELIRVKNATHSTAHVEAGALYFDKLEALLGDR